MSPDPVFVKNAVAGMVKARDELAAAPKDTLNYELIRVWRQKHESAMNRADHIVSGGTAFNVAMYCNDFEAEADTELLDALRRRILNKLELVIGGLDANLLVRKPELEELIDRLPASKLRTLLDEFYAMQASQPNAASMILRTVLCLIIKQRARRAQSQGNTSPAVAKIAASDDLDFLSDLNIAIREKIFDNGDTKFLVNFRDGNMKDMFDNVTHKHSDKWTIKDKGELKEAIEMITKLLHAIL